MIRAYIHLRFPVKHLTIRLLLAFVLGLTLPFQSWAEQEQISAASGAFPFPPRANGLTNAPPTIGRPVISIPGDLLQKLGGSDVTNMVVSSIGDLLSESGRFTLTYRTNPMYGCLISLSDLQISQHDKTSGMNGSGFFGGLFTNLVKVNLNGKPTQVDWSKDNSKLSVRCSVSMNIVDSQTKDVLAGNEGDVIRNDTTKNINMELAGLTANNGETNNLTTNTVNFENRLIRLASYYALTNMLTQIDRQELYLPSTPASGNSAKDEPKPDNGSKGSALERLTQAKDLLDKGLIDKDDYEKMKQKILADSSF